MDLLKIKKMVADAYALLDTDTTIPRFATQFTFADGQILIRIPIYEHPLPRQLLLLVLAVVKHVVPERSTNEEDLRNDLERVAAGENLPGDQFSMERIGQSTTADGGPTAHAVNEIRILLHYGE